MTVRIEVLFFDGCPNHEALLPRLRELLSAHGVADPIELRRVEDEATAERERFLGSPTLRVDGKDVDQGVHERQDFGLKCRLFATSDGLRGMPADEWVVSALERAGRPRPLPTASESAWRRAQPRFPEC